MSYTKGEWELVRSGLTAGSLVVRGRKDGKIVNIAKLSAYGEAARANARLIAAAPELLAAAKKAQAIFDIEGRSLPSLNDAIAKAEGRS